MLKPELLQPLGWNHFFQQQISLDEWELCSAFRVSSVERQQIKADSGERSLVLPMHHKLLNVTVGDWLLVDDQDQFSRCLDRQSLLSRKAAGTHVAEQALAANVDTLFIVSSANADFNLGRTERYLALAYESQIDAVLILSKADLNEDLSPYLDAIAQFQPKPEVVCVDCRSPLTTDLLSPWLIKGHTLVLLGSSGTGKSTLSNTLMHQEAQQTQSIREQDAKGRHTTTSRHLLQLPSGALLIDTPGMRELKLAACEQGVETTFADIVSLSAECRFSDCQHQSEPGCAVMGAIDSGTLDPRRLKSFQKLMREQAHNAESLSQARLRNKQFAKGIKQVMVQKKAKRYHSENR